MEGTSKLHRYVSVDQELWIKDRIRTAIKMSLELNKLQRVGADEPAFSHGINGIINGTAIELIRTCGLEPMFVNLQR